MPTGETIKRVGFACQSAGLRLFGGFHPRPEDSVPDLAREFPCRTVLVIGNAGSEIWPRFRDSPEFEQAADPLNAWTQRVVGRIAADHGATAVYPFGGPPYHPFQQWARRAAPVFASPIGMLIHPRFGLWIAFRGALLFGERLALEAPSESVSPCEVCADRPCLSTCPVGAFSPAGYDVPACAGYLVGESGRSCLDRSCRARLACPVGTDHAYDPDHGRFHMAAFAASHVGSPKPV